MGSTRDGRRDHDRRHSDERDYYTPVLVRERDAPEIERIAARLEQRDDDG